MDQCQDAAAAPHRVPTPSSCPLRSAPHLCPREGYRGVRATASRGLRLSMQALIDSSKNKHLPW